MPRMTCDEWIASRTNNPDKLGREKWENIIMTAMNLLYEEKNLILMKTGAGDDGRVS